MPNHVTNKIVFDVSQAEIVFGACCPDGKFDFKTLVPMPPHIYLGNLSAEDEKDFPCNWMSWSRENWGTKWNAYSCSCGANSEGAFIEFDTAWNAPYPIMAAFANRFKIAFEHRYFDEGHNFWGIENWSKADGEGGLICRTSKRRSHADDKKPLCIELKGYDPDADDDAA